MSRRKSIQFINVQNNIVLLLDSFDENCELLLISFGTIIVTLNNLLRLNYYKD